jgi:hypothetical protein
MFTEDNALEEFIDEEQYKYDSTTTLGKVLVVSAICKNEQVEQRSNDSNEWILKDRMDDSWDFENNVYRVYYDVMSKVNKLINTNYDDDFYERDRIDLDSIVYVVIKDTHEIEKLTPRQVVYRYFTGTFLTGNRFPVTLSWYQDEDGDVYVKERYTGSIENDVKLFGFKPKNDKDIEIAAFEFAYNECLKNDAIAIFDSEDDAIWSIK